MDNNMLKKIIAITVCSITALFLTGCNALHPSPPDSPMAGAPIIYNRSGSAAACDHALASANRQLIVAKQRVHIGTSGYVDWGSANDAMAAAVSAQSYQDYNMCVKKANEVTVFVQRDQTYLRWKGSVNS